MKKKTLLKKITEHESWNPGFIVECLEGKVKIWRDHFPSFKQYQDLKSFLETFYNEDDQDEEHVFLEFQSVLRISGIKLKYSERSMFKEAYPEVLSMLGIK
tara:strand:+ start:72 stop:374 length:303 start_codon:yes stop_codon:yes gene_type:complete